MIAKHALKRPAFRLTRLQLWLFLLATLVVAGVIAGSVVFARGLVVTNLNDLVPWGLWITIDLSSIALSAGAFLLCAAVYLLGLKQYQPVARTATFIGLIGYSMAVLCLLLDIGRPDRFWHALVYWNTHSVLWEVTMCVTLYFAVLALETAPILGQAAWMQRRLPRMAGLLGKAHTLAPYLAVVGLGLSLLHQSSLGATYGVLKARPIWYRPDLSVLFIVSAMAAGPALTVLASTLSARLTRRAHVDDRLLERLSFFIGWVLVGYLYFRFWDAFAMTYTYEPGRTEGLNLITQGPLSFNFWIVEILLGAVIPIVILLNARLRRNPLLRMLALALVVAGVVAYRWDTNLAGQMVVMSYLPQDISARYTTYFPSLIEFVSGAGIVAYGLLAFTLGVRFLNVVDHRRAQHHEAQPEAEPTLALSN
ncbi:MAG TPA: NrfD/PsrC family molybdoenzyme membrane anchor subunit [Anaerolineae bacterium]|nr:NrfD/PsrC family molybdoenzyme membrane anchor subunit [Anaerolineae bacterium]